MSTRTGARGIEEGDVPIRPAVVASIRRPGLVPRRLLMFGGGVLLGDGLSAHDAGLPGAVADALARTSPRGVEITVVVEPLPLSRRALDGLRGLRLHRFDAVVVVLASPPPASWTAVGSPQADLRRLADLLDSECSPQAALFIYESPDSGAGDSLRREGAGREGRSSQHPPPVSTRVRYRELPAPMPRIALGTPFPQAAYQAWGELIVERLDVAIADMSTTGPRSGAPFRGGGDEEDRRQEAIRALQLWTSEPDESLMFLLRQARVTFGVAGAALVVVGTEQTLPYAAVGEPPPILPRDEAYTTIAIQSDRPTVISDALVDPRAPLDPDTGTPASTRFYAGYPIHTWDGYRIGALCIHDIRPHDVKIYDLVRLWEIAGRVEEHLWLRALRAGARPGLPTAPGPRERPPGSHPASPRRRGRGRHPGRVRRLLRRLRPYR